MRIWRIFLLQVHGFSALWFFQVAERALFYWNNESIVRAIEANVNVVMPVMFPSLYRITKEQTNQAILTLVYNVLKAFTDMNSKLFEDLTVNYEKEQGK